MIPTSKTNSFTCAEDVCHDRSICCAEESGPANHQAQSLKRYLYHLRGHFHNFLGTDRWGETVLLQAGGSHYILKMEDIQKRWRQGR